MDTNVYPKNVLYIITELHFLYTLFQIEILQLLQYAHACLGLEIFPVILIAPSMGTANVCL